MTQHKARFCLSLSVYVWNHMSCAAKSHVYHIIIGNVLIPSQLDKLASAVTWKVMEWQCRTSCWFLVENVFASVCYSPLSTRRVAWLYYKTCEKLLSFWQLQAWLIKLQRAHCLKRHGERWIASWDLLYGRPCKMANHHLCRRTSWTYLSVCAPIETAWVARTRERAHLWARVSVRRARSQHAAGGKSLFIFLSLLNLPASRLWSSPWQSCVPVPLNGPGSYNTQ